MSEFNLNLQIFLITTIDGCKSMGTFGEKSFVYINIAQKELADTFETRIDTFTGPVHHSKPWYLKCKNGSLISQHKP